MRELTKNISIRVTDADIATATPGSAERCALAVALKREFGRKWSVCAFAVCHAHTEDGMEAPMFYRLTDEGKRFVRMFDSGAARRAATVKLVDGELYPGAPFLANGSWG